MKLLFLLFAAAVIRGVQGPTPPGELLQDSAFEDVVVHQLLPRDRVVHLDPGPEDQAGSAGPQCLSGPPCDEARDLSEAVEEQETYNTPHGGNSELVTGRTSSKKAGAHQEQKPEPGLFSDDDSSEAMQSSIRHFSSLVDLENALESYCVPGCIAQAIPSQVSPVNSSISVLIKIQSLSLSESHLLFSYSVPVQRYLESCMTDGRPEKVCALLAALLECRLASSQCCLHFEFNADNFLQGMTMEVSDGTEWLVIDPAHCVAVDVKFLEATVFPYSVHSSSSNWLLIPVNQKLQVQRQAFSGLQCFDRVREARNVVVKWLLQAYSVDSSSSNWLLIPVNQKLQVLSQALSALRCFIGVIEEYLYRPTLYLHRWNELLSQLNDLLTLYYYIFADYYCIY